METRAQKRQKLFTIPEGEVVSSPEGEGEVVSSPAAAPTKEVEEVFSGLSNVSPVTSSTNIQINNIIQNNDMDENNKNLLPSILDSEDKKIINQLLDRTDNNIEDLNEECDKGVLTHILLDKDTVEEYISNISNKGSSEKTGFSQMMLDVAQNTSINKLLNMESNVSILNSKLKDIAKEVFNTIMKPRKDCTSTSGTSGIKEQIQMQDMWGKELTKWAKKDKETCCYLCGHKIVNISGKDGVVPEMEHKKPCTLAFTTGGLHYRALDLYKFDDKKETIYKQWKTFVNENLNNFKELYNLINCSNDYTKETINTSFNNIFKNFRDSIDVTINDQTDFFEELIKFWLLEFAYSHHTCNQAKSSHDLIDDTQYNRFTSNIQNRINNNNTKTKLELHNTIDNNIINGANNRKDRTCIMLEHLKSTSEEITNKYNAISNVLNIDHESAKLLIIAKNIRNSLMRKDGMKNTAMKLYMEFSPKKAGRNTRRKKQRRNKTYRKKKRKGKKSIKKRNRKTNKLRKKK